MMMVFFCTWALAPVFVEVEFSQGAEANNNHMATSHCKGGWEMQGKAQTLGGHLMSLLPIKTTRQLKTTAHSLIHFEDLLCI